MKNVFLYALVTGSLPESWAVMFHTVLNTFKLFLLCCRGGEVRSLMQQKCTESQRYGLSGRGMTPVSYILIQQFLPALTHLRLSELHDIRLLGHTCTK